MMNLGPVERVLGIGGLVVCVALLPFLGSTSPQPVDRGPVAVGEALGEAVPGAAGPPGSPASGVLPADPSSVCPNGGSDGKRVEALYVHSAQQDRLGSMKKTFQQWLERGDKAFVEAAKRTGGGVRRLRLLRDQQCRIVVRNVTIDKAALQDVDDIAAAIKAQGYQRSDRKYVVWYDAPGCGLAFGVGGNDSPQWYNLYNFGPHYATIGTDCWGWAPTVHELLHTLGAVQLGAPHASANGHCWDDEDIMCYDDQGLPQHGLKVICKKGQGPDADAVENQIDCNGDDYFSTKPTPGSYLDTHWNVANNEFLFR